MHDETLAPLLVRAWGLSMTHASQSLLDLLLVARTHTVKPQASDLYLQRELQIVLGGLRGTDQGPLTWWAVTGEGVKVAVGAVSPHGNAANSGTVLIA